MATSTPQNPFEQKAPIPGVKKVIAVGSGKGGVGKSTVAVNLALSLSEQGLKTGILDADIYGPSIPRMLGVLNQKPEVTEENKLIPLERYGIKIMSIGFLIEEDAAVVWRGPMLFKAVNQFLFDVAWDDLDVLVIDLPPGTGDVQLSLAQKVPLDGGIIVSTPQNISLIDAKKALDMMDRLSIPVLGLVENMSYLEQGEEKIQLFPKGDLDQFLEGKDMPKLAEMPFYPQLGQAGETGIPLAQMKKDHPAHKAFDGLAQKVRNSIF